MDARQALRSKVEGKVSELDHLGAWVRLALLCSAALDVYGAWPDIEYRLAVALDLSGRHEEAELILADLTERTPLSERSWHSLVLVRNRLGKIDEALAAALEGIRVLEAAGIELDSLQGAIEWLETRRAQASSPRQTELRLLN
jgi:tetratricopeptide (TPR) repeat protein